MNGYLRTGLAIAAAAIISVVGSYMCTQSALNKSEAKYDSQTGFTMLTIPARHGAASLQVIDNGVEVMNTTEKTHIAYDFTAATRGQVPPMNVGLQLSSGKHNLEAIVIPFAPNRERNVVVPETTKFSVNVPYTQ